MEKDNEFREIGKKTPYKVPDGFFGQVSETTLRKAKQRAEKSRKMLILRRAVALAASLAGIAVLGYYWHDGGSAETTVFVVEEQNITQQPVGEIQPAEDMLQKAVVAEKSKSEAEIKVEVVDAPEELGDVLADLSDEDLLQMAALMKTDPFMGEVQQ